MSGLMYKLSDIAGGDFSDWVYGTSEYVVPDGYAAYAFEPGADGATIDTGKWLIGVTGRQSGTETAITTGYKSKWIDQSVTGGTIFFAHPVTSITLSAGDGMVYCRKNVLNQS